VLSILNDADVRGVTLNNLEVIVELLAVEALPQAAIEVKDVDDR
jgi:hypothetical protein